MVGTEPEPELDEAQVSALAELGNIALSAAAGALAILHDSVVVPSVPHVGYDMAGALLLDMVHPRVSRLPAYLVEAALADPSGEFSAHFIWIPEP